MITVTALTGKDTPVKAATELSSHRQKNPQTELMLSFQNQRMGSAMMRSSPKTRNAGMMSVAKIAINTSV